MIRRLVALTLQQQGRSGIFSFSAGEVNDKEEDGLLVRVKHL